MSRRSALTAVAAALAVACTQGIQYPGQLVGSFNTTLVPASNGCLLFADLPGFCADNGSPGPCDDGGYPDGGTTVLVVSSGADDAGYISYQSGSQSATSDGTFNGQTVVTQATATRLFVTNADAGCVAEVTETIELTLYSSLDGGCQGGIPPGPPPTQIDGVWQTQDSPACGLLVDQVVPTPALCCPNPLDGGACGTPPPPACAVSFLLVGQGRPSPP